MSELLRRPDYMTIDRNGGLLKKEVVLPTPYLIPLELRKVDRDKVRKSGQSRTDY
jgi:hypothetical protein